jgi:hypothetical protein
MKICRLGNSAAKRLWLSWRRREPPARARAMRRINYYIQPQIHTRNIQKKTLHLIQLK